MKSHEEHIRMMSTSKIDEKPEETSSGEINFVRPIEADQKNDKTSAISSPFVVQSELKQLITPKHAWHYKIIPESNDDSVLGLYIDNIKNSNGILEELEIILGRKIHLISVPSGLIDQALKLHYPNNTFSSANKSLPKLLTDKETFLHTLIEESHQLGSSDIHIEKREKEGIIRFRVDGHLIVKHSIPETDYPALINAIKIKSSLDIAEKRLPQDGRIHLQLESGSIDIRVSIIPTNYGEKVVLRLLNKDSKHIDLERIGFSEEQLSIYKNGFLRSNGIILISGPTGSGKTTTLYATIKELNKDNKNILTIEDPVEYTMEGINQVQLKENIGLTFPLALKTFLRQDPDIIMIGEIRDPETAQIAIRAALTGHLVLSTIHTNSAWGIISRLIDMNIPEYLLSATLNIAAAQRLIRLLCPECKTTSSEPHPLEAEYLGSATSTFSAVGCEQCNFTGYKGRRALFEVIEITNELKEMIKTDQYSSDSYQDAFKGSTLKEQAKDLCRKGATSFEEVLPILLDI